MNLAGKNVVIYGAGVSGMSAYELVKEKGGRAIVYDDDPSAPHATTSKTVFDGADVIVLSPGVDGEKDFLLDARLENKTIVSELELASSVCVAEQIAITGTNGKTTTTMLIDAIFKNAGFNSHAVGNIGAAFSAIADKLDATEIAVIEASSFQLESSPRFSPDTAILLNIAPDHLERHKSMKRYIAAKSNIFRNQSESDFVIYNADDENISALVPEMRSQRVPFSMTRPVDGAYISSGFICFRGKPIVEIDELEFRGAELQNALAAAAAAMLHNVAPYTIASSLIGFIRPEYRRGLIAEVDGIRVYNDSKATNISAAIAAAGSMDGDSVMILGGSKRRESFKELFDFLVSDGKVKAAAVTGENAQDILSAAAEAGFGSISAAETLDEALSLAFDLARENGCENVLFSPASKSFDSYKNYKERGKAFDNAVKRFTK